MRFRGRHELVWIRGDQTFEHFTLLNNARNERFFLNGNLAHIETQLRFPVACVGAVTVEAVVGENGPHVAIELDFIGDLGCANWRTYGGHAKCAKKQKGFEEKGGDREKGAVHTTQRGRNKSAGA